MRRLKSWNGSMNCSTLRSHPGTIMYVELIYVASLHKVTEISLIFISWCQVSNINVLFFVCRAKRERGTGPRLLEGLKVRQYFCVTTQDHVGLLDNKKHSSSIKSVDRSVFLSVCIAASESPSGEVTQPAKRPCVTPVCTGVMEAPRAQTTNAAPAEPPKLINMETLELIESVPPQPNSQPEPQPEHQPEPRSDPEMELDDIASILGLSSVTELNELIESECPLPEPLSTKTKTELDEMVWTLELNSETELFELFEPQPEQDPFIYSHQSDDCPSLLCCSPWGFVFFPVKGDRSFSSSDVRV